MKHAKINLNQITELLTDVQLKEINLNINKPANMNYSDTSNFYIYVKIENNFIFFECQLKNEKITISLPYEQNYKMKL